MIVLALGALVAAILAERLRTYSFETTQLVHRFRMHRVRDDLRRLAIDGRVDASSWIFKYLDTSLSSGIRHLDSLTLWKAVVLGLALRKEPRTQAARTALYRALEQPGNECLQNVHRAQGDLLLQYILARHPALHSLLRMALRCLGTMARTLVGAAKLQAWLSEKMRKIGAVQSESSEFSTLREYAPV